MPAGSTIPSRRAGAAYSENEIASIPIDVLMALHSVCALEQHEGDHRFGTVERLTAEIDPLYKTDNEG